MFQPNDKAFHSLHGVGYVLGVEQDRLLVVFRGYTNWFYQAELTELSAGQRLGHTEAEFRELKAQYHYECLCCGKREPEIQLEPDHVVPLAKGGSPCIENIQPLCRSCNSHKRMGTVNYRPAYHERQRCNREALDRLLDVQDIQSRFRELNRA